MKDNAKQFYGSQAWKDCREQYMKKAGGLCELCLKQGIYTPGEVVHHIRPITSKNINDPSIVLNFDNLMLLCRQHHEQIHDRNRKRYTIDAMGNVSILE